MNQAWFRDSVGGGSGYGDPGPVPSIAACLHENELACHLLAGIIKWRANSFLKVRSEWPKHARRSETIIHARTKAIYCLERPEMSRDHYHLP